MPHIASQLLGQPASEPSAAHRALSRAVSHLLSQQDASGWWKGALETNVTIDAEDLLLRQFLGIRTAGQTEQTARWIRSRQRADGSWATFWGGPPDVSTTVEAYMALRLAGDPPDAAHMRAARDMVIQGGGMEASRVFTRMWLALFGEWPWRDLPAIPPELVLLPSGMPFNVYEFACWARQTIVPLAVVRAVRPVRPLGFRLDELRTGRRPPSRPLHSRRQRGLRHLDRAAAAYEKIAFRAVRHQALRRCAQWIAERQEADGSWGGIQPPWVYSLIALTVLGWPLDHPVVRRGLAGLDRFTIQQDSAEGAMRFVEACQSPVWDTALAVIALSDAGLPADHRALMCAGDWLLKEEVRVRGDWAVRRPGLPPGGWAFEFDNDLYPDTDDTAAVLLALRRTGVESEAAADRASRWLCGMQSRGGGWAAFDVDNTCGRVADLPFCDFGEVIDPPSADVTAHVVEALCEEGLGESTAVHHAVTWLIGEQEPGGSWFGRWGANHIYGVGAVLPALRRAGLHADHPALQAAVAWLLRHQNPDGGWGEDMRSYRDPSWVGRGTSTASQTSWALLALHAAGLAESDAAGRGVRWLVDRQRPDGSWDEPQYTGTGFPGDFFINYHLYRLVFPISALGRILGKSAEAR